MKKTSLFVCIIFLELVLPRSVSAEDFSFTVVTDPAFETYVNPELLQRASNSADPVLLTDVAMQFAEAERILLRSHIAISSKEIMDSAFRFALATKDQVTIDRLKQGAEKYGDTGLLAEFSKQEKLAAESRSVARPNFSIQENIRSQDLVNGILGSVDRAILMQNRSLVEQLETSLDAMKETLGEEVTREMADYLSKEKATIPENANESVLALGRLADVSRQSSSRFQMRSEGWAPQRRSGESGRWPSGGNNHPQPSNDWPSTGGWPSGEGGGGHVSPRLPKFDWDQQISPSTGPVPREVFQNEQQSHRSQVTAPMTRVLQPGYQFPNTWRQGSGYQTESCEMTIGGQTVHGTVHFRPQSSHQWPQSRAIIPQNAFTMLWLALVQNGGYFTTPQLFPTNPNSLTQTQLLILDVVQMSGVTIYCSNRLRIQYIEDSFGAMVVYVHPSSPLRGSVKIGDVISEIDGQQVNNPWIVELHYRWTHFEKIDGSNGFAWNFWRWLGIL